VRERSLSRKSRSRIYYVKFPSSLVPEATNRRHRLRLIGTSSSPFDQFAPRETFSPWTASHVPFVPNSSVSSVLSLFETRKRPLFRNRSGKASIGGGSEPAILLRSQTTRQPGHPVDSVVPGSDFSLPRLHPENWFRSASRCTVRVPASFRGNHDWITQRGDSRSDDCWWPRGALIGDPKIGPSAHAHYAKSRE